MVSKYSKQVRAAVAGAVALGGLVAASASFAADEGSIARGGRLYDKWYKVIKAEVPAESHPLYPAANEKYAGDPGANWRCKECHGWDGKGVNGAYASGSHATGIIGIDGMAGGDPAAVVAVLTGAEHGYGDKLSEADLADLADKMVDHAPLDPHIGSIAIQRFIQERQPLLTLHGHVHESRRLTGRWREQSGRTTSFNAANDGPELALVRFDPADLMQASLELIPPQSSASS